jgi:hypothetical protein
MLLRRLTPHFIGHIPLAAYHDAHPHRGYRRIPECRISDVILSLISSLVPSDRNGTPASLRFLGQGLLDIGGLSDTEFCDFISHAVSRRIAERLRLTESVMKRLPQCPAYWREEVANLYRGTIEDLRDPNCWIPVEFRNGGDPDLAKGATKEMIVMAGRLFYHWPDIVDAAVLLRERGKRVSLVLS